MQGMLEKWVLTVSGEFKTQMFPLVLTMRPTRHISNKRVTFSLIRSGAEQEDIKHHNCPISIIYEKQN